MRSNRNDSTPGEKHFKARKKRNKSENLKVSQETQERKLSPEETISRKKKILKKIRMELILKLLIIGATLFITFTFVFGVAIIQTDDMYPAVRQGDVAIYYRLGKGSLMNSDVVLYNAGNKTRIGRIQACPGSAIGRTKGGKLTIDGNMQPVQERMGIYYETKTSKYDKLKYPSVIQSGRFLVLGDKREDAVDSRSLGLIERTNIKGKVFTVLRRRAL